jgi:hypothetical protein
MSNIKITDGVSVLLNVEGNTASSIAKYIPKLDNIALQVPAFADLLGRTIDKIPKGASIATGISIEEPVAISATNLKLTINAQVGGSIELIMHAEKDGKDEEKDEDETPLLESDPMEECPTFKRNQCYVAVALNASASAGLSGSRGKLNFGIEPGASVAFTCYRRCEPTPGQTTLGNLVQASIAGYTIPATLEDLRSMPEGAVATVEFNGSLKLSGSANLLSFANPLASVDLPADVGTLGVKAGGTITVSAAFEVSGGHQIRAHKVGANEVVLGYYRKNGFTSQFGVTASAGVTAGVGGGDLFSLVLEQISSSAKADQEALEDAKLSKKQISDIQAAVKAGIDRKLEVSLSDQFSFLKSHEAAFLYRISLDKLNAAGCEALANALRGDLKSLPDDDSPLPAGIARMKSVLSKTRETKTVFKINLLGIYNWFSISKLISSGRVMVDDDKGELNIVDKASASRVTGAANNFRLNDHGKRDLSRLLAESFLFTTAYTSSGGPMPDLSAIHTFFTMSHNTNLDDLKDWIALARTLDLEVPAAFDQVIGGKLGPGAVTAETGYTPALTPTLFLNADGKARDVTEYERIGREALLAVVHEEYRRFPFETFKKMKKVGITKSREFKDLFPHSNEVELETLGADYITIKWWADSMRGLGERLVEMRDYRQKNPHADLKNDKKFGKLRHRLADQMKHVAGNTQAGFGEAWGLVAMYLASGRGASANVRITNAKLPGALYAGDHGEKQALATAAGRPV